LWLAFPAAWRSHSDTAASRLSCAALTLILLLVAFPVTAQAGAGVDSLDRYVRSELVRQRIPGVSIAVLRGDTVVLARGYGYANVEHHVPCAVGRWFSA
jgi:CubicO group peptidase (beta-lactamase class C family)